mgnify:CR=1 FL=1
MPPKPVTAEELTPRFGPYRYGGTAGGDLRLTNWGVPSGDEGRFDVARGGFDVTRALAAERPASELRTRPPLDLTSLSQMFARALGLPPGAIGPSPEGFPYLGGETGPGGGPSTGLSASEGGRAGLPGGLKGLALGALIGMIPGIGPPLSAMLTFGKGMDALMNALGIGTTPGLSSSDVDVATAAEHGEVSEADTEAAMAQAEHEAQSLESFGLFGAGPAPTGGATATGVPGVPGVTVSGVAPNFGIGTVSTDVDPGFGAGPGAGAGAAPGAGEGGPGAGDGQSYHRGGVTRKGPPRGPEARATLLEGEYVMNPKATKLRRGLLEAINKGASKAALAKIIEAGR